MLMYANVSVKTRPKNLHNFPHFCNKILEMLNLVSCVSIMDTDTCHFREI